MHDVIYNNSIIKVTVVPPLLPHQNADFEWPVLTENDAYINNDLIARCIINNVYEVCLEYRYLDADVKDYVILFDVSVNQILQSSNSELKENDIISVGVPYSSRLFDEALPDIKEGVEFLLFGKDTAKLKHNDVLYMPEYVDYWVSSLHKLLLMKFGNYYLCDDFFSGTSYPSVNLTNKLGITEDITFALANEYSRAIFKDSIDSDSAPLLLEIENIAIQEGIPEARLILEYYLNKFYYDPYLLWMVLDRLYVVEYDVFEQNVREKVNFYKEVS